MSEGQAGSSYANIRLFNKTRRAFSAGPFRFQIHCRGAHPRQEDRYDVVLTRFGRSDVQRGFASGWFALGSKRLSVSQLAAEGGLETDDVLILLWDAGFERIVSPDDYLKRGDANRARRALGMATRREVASPEHWQNKLGLTSTELTALLESLGVGNPFDGKHLRKKAINRLNGEYRRRSSTQAPALEVKTIAAVELAGPPLVWEGIGHERQLTYLSVEEVTSIHYANHACWSQK